MKTPVSGCFMQQLLDAISVVYYLVKTRLEYLEVSLQKLGTGTFRKPVKVAMPNQMKDHSSYTVFHH